MRAAKRARPAAGGRLRDRDVSCRNSSSTAPRDQRRHRQAGARLADHFHARAARPWSGPTARPDELGHQLTLHRACVRHAGGGRCLQADADLHHRGRPDGCAGCSVSMNPEDALSNSPAYGAYEVEMMKRTLGWKRRRASSSVES